MTDQPAYAADSRARRIAAEVIAAAVEDLMHSDEDQVRDAVADQGLSTEAEREALAAEVRQELAHAHVLTMWEFPACP